MKNRLPFAALTFAFTVAGACMGYALNNSPEMLIPFVIIIGFAGAAAAAWSGDLL